MLRRKAVVLCAFVAISAAIPGALAQPTPDPGCTSMQAWNGQYNPLSDTTNLKNVAYLDYYETYWLMGISGSSTTPVTITGQFPAGRYMSLQVYGGNGHAVAIDGLRDSDINPDPGQNNPFRSGGTSAQGTYTIQIIFGMKPKSPPANTIYTGLQNSVNLMYRVYVPTDPNNLAGAYAPPLPTVKEQGGTLVTCPVRPIIVPQTATVWGRLDQDNFNGAPPASGQPAALNPSWTLHPGSDSLFPFANLDDNYMVATLSRQFLTAPYSGQLAVMQMYAPTFPNTMTGTPPYMSANVRYWSVCTDDPLTTGVSRCAPDYLATNTNGLVTFVISDPAYKPSSAVLSQWGAEWLAWGALAPNDSMDNLQGTELNGSNGVFYQNRVFYRQLVSDPSFTQSILNVSKLPGPLQQHAMGNYWPRIGYCTLTSFTSKGIGCLP